MVDPRSRCEELEQLVQSLQGELEVKNQEIKSLKDKCARMRSHTPVTKMDGCVDEVKEGETGLEKEFAEGILNAIQDTVYIFDPLTGEPVRWNRAMSGISGYSDEEIAAREVISDWYSEEEASKLSETINRVLEEGRATIEVDLLTKDGRSVPTEYSTSLIMNPETGKQCLIAVGRDMTERIRAEEMLKESRQLYLSLVENLKEMVFLLDEKGNVQFVNSYVENHYGINKEEAIGIPLCFFFCGESIQAVEALVDIVANSKMDSVLDCRCSDQSYELKVTPLLDSGRITGLICIGRDVTKRRKAEAELALSQKQWRETFDAINDMIIIVDRDKKVVQANRAAHEEFHDVENLTGVFCYKLLKGSEVPYDCDSCTVFDDGEPIHDVFLSNNLGGRWLDFYAYPVIRESNKPDYIVHVIRDISEEMFIRRNLENAFEIINLSPAVAFRWKNEENWPVEFVSNNVKNVFGYSGEDFLAGRIPYSSVVHPDDRERVICEVADFTTIKGNDSITHKPYRIITKSGKTRWVDDRIFVKRDKEGRVTHFQGLVLDITDRMLVEEKLEMHRRQLLSIFDGINEIIYVSDPETYEILFINKHFQELLGKNVIGGNCYREFQGSDEPCSFCTNEIISNNNGETHQWEHRNPVLEKDFLLFDRIIAWPDGRDVRFEMAIDITDKKKAEKALLESERAYRGIFEATMNGLAILDMNGNHREVNTAQCRMFGYAKEEFLELKRDDFAHPDSYGIFDEYLETLNRGEDFKGVAKVIKKNGEAMTIDVFATPFHYRGEMCILTVITDITEHERAQKMLKEERDLLDVITKNIGAGVAVISKEYKTVWANQVIENIFGDVNGTHCYASYNKRDSICPGCGVMKVFEDGTEVSSHEQKGADRDGHVIWSEIIATPIKNDKGEISGALELVVPITKRKVMEEKLRMSENELRALSRSLIDSQERERSRLAMDLHDQMGKQITMLAFEIDAMLYDEVVDKKSLERIHAEIQNTAQELRNICKGLGPMGLGNVGLKNSLQNLVNDYRVRSDMVIRDRIDEVPPDDIREETAIAVYRIVQEALTNIAKHSMAKNVQVRVRVVEDSLTVLIIDDGKGFNPEGIGRMRGFGILGMKERASLCGGSVGIRVSEEGTVVEGVFPMKGSAN